MTDKPDIYKGDKGTLLYISDLCIDYDNAKSIKSLKHLIDEIKEIADNQLNSK